MPLFVLFGNVHTDHVKILYVFTFWHYINTIYVNLCTHTIFRNPFKPIKNIKVCGFYVSLKVFQKVRYRQIHKMDYMLFPILLKVFFDKIISFKMTFFTK